MQFIKVINRFKIKKVLKRLGYINGYRVRRMDSLIKLGTSYGGWIIPEGFINDNSICYLAGAGEDISFDVGLAEKYSCQVNIFDPTQRANIHFENLVQNVKNDIKFEINNDHTQHYSISKEKISLLHFYNLGLWKEYTDIKFFAPKLDEHVSHSILNLQKTDKFFIGRVDRLSSLMKLNNHCHIDILKIDIEGAEYEVLKTIIEDKLDIKIICVEYDEAYNPIDQDYLKRIKKSINSLRKQKYLIISMDEKFNITFIKKQVFKALRKIENTKSFII
jgi:FkbM family methyltransferase